MRRWGIWSQGLVGSMGGIRFASIRILVQTLLVQREGPYRRFYIPSRPVGGASYSQLTVRKESDDEQARRGMELRARPAVVRDRGTSMTILMLGK